MTQLTRLTNSAAASAQIAARQEVAARYATRGTRFSEVLESAPSSTPARTNAHSEQTTSRNGTPAVSSAPNPFNPAGGVRLRDSPVPATAPVATPVQPEPASDPVELLKTTMEQMGISSEGLKFTEQRYQVIAPHASWWNHDILIEMGPGNSERFDVDLTCKDPEIAAVEIQRWRELTGA